MIPITRLALELVQAMLLSEPALVTDRRQGKGMLQPDVGLFVFFICIVRGPMYDA